MPSAISTSGFGEAIESDQRKLRLMLWRAGLPGSEPQGPAALGAFRKLLGAHHLALEQTLLAQLRSTTSLAPYIARTEAMHELLERASETLLDHGVTRGIEKKARLDLVGTLFERQALTELQELLPALRLLRSRQAVEANGSRYRRLVAGYLRDHSDYALRV